MYICEYLCDKMIHKYIFMFFILINEYLRYFIHFYKSLHAIINNL